MATRVLIRSLSLQKSEATNSLRNILVDLATVETVTVSVSKAGGAFTSSSATASQVDGPLHVVALTTDDLDTVGELALKLVGTTDTTYVYGITVHDHNPWSIFSSLVSTAKTVTGSIASLLNRIYRRVGYGYISTDTSTNTVVTRDGSSGNSDLLLTQTIDTVGNVTTITPTE